MKAQTINSRQHLYQSAEILYLFILLDNVKERIAHLTPGKNCKSQQFHSLTLEKINLTLSVNKAILKARGCTFAEETDSTYVCNSIVLKLGGIYCQRIRA